MKNTLGIDCAAPDGSEDKVLSIEDGLVLSDALLQDLPQDQRRALSSTQRLCLALKRLLPLRDKRPARVVSQADTSLSK